MKFYASWVVAAKSGEWDVKFIGYEDIIKNPVKTLDSVLEHASVEAVSVRDARIEEISDNVNKGETGRGATLDPLYKKLIETFADSFQGIDFSPLGIVSAQAILKDRA